VTKLGYVPYVQNYQQIKDEDLRKKAIFINEEMDKLRRVK
jgi:hypothetical protein